jgi:hypothetical protein
MKYNIQACWRCDVMWRYRLPTYTVSRLDCANNSFCCWPLLAAPAAAVADRLPARFLPTSFWDGRD